MQFLDRQNLLRGIFVTRRPLNDRIYAVQLYHYNGSANEARQHWISEDDPTARFIQCWADHFHELSNVNDSSRQE
ncbi:MAG: hypothetical protein EZS28_016115 [Streblomastix strix]|uniref:Uncharacterized protein n=1 Tax=Streblomastix strix TaxID=222440 RepID=A0A5J4W1F4_9EUKA|nr:MAG: hypothetical protein EZS28_016115 [Streblomastix strix]